MYQQFAILFCLTLTGYICRKRNIIDDGMNRGMNRFIITVAYPCLILNRMGNLEMPKGAFSNFIIVTILSVILFLILGGLAYLYAKGRKINAEDSPVAEFAMFAPNNGFVGFPIALTFFGDLGLLYMIACNLALNIIFFSYGIALMKRGKGLPNKTWWIKACEIVGLLINPKISAAFLGLILCNFQIEFPEIINSYLSMIGSIATPMAMVFIGGTLATCKLSEAVKDRLVLETSGIKLFVAPSITLAIVWFLPLDPLVKSILVLGNAIAVATTVPIFAEQYDRNKKLASEVLFITTLLSMATIPLTVWCLHMMF